MICPECKREIPDGAKFCKYCGVSLKTAAAPEPAEGVCEETLPGPAGGVCEAVFEENAQDAEGPAAGSGKDGKRKKKLRPVFIIIPAAALCCIAAAFVLLIMFTDLLPRSLDTAQSEALPEGFSAYYEEIDSGRVAENDGLYYISGQIIIKAAEGYTSEEVQKIIKKNGGSIAGYISVSGDYQVNLSGEETYDEMLEICESLAGEEEIASADVSFVFALDAESTDYGSDPWQEDEDDGSSETAGWDESLPDGSNWWAESLRLSSVWDMDIESDTVKIGIIDTMFDTESEELSDGVFAAVWNNPEDEEGNCAVSALYQNAVSESDTAAGAICSHGSYIASIIAAKAGNGTGITGICSGAQLYGYALAGTQAASSDVIWTSVFEYECAIANLLDEGVSLINISAGASELSVQAAALDEQALAFLEESSGEISDFLLKYIDEGYDFLIVKSAGNSSVDASYDLFGAIKDETVAEHIIIVGAAGYSDGVYYAADFSNTGDRVDFYAPGEDILTAGADAQAAVISGSSASAAMITGLAGLIMETDSSLTASQIREILEKSLYPSEGLEESEDAALAAQSLSSYTAAGAVRIPDAYVCVSLAQDAASKGLVSGYFYAAGMDDDGNTAYSVLSEYTLTIYDEDGEAVFEAEAETAAYVRSEAASALVYGSCGLSALRAVLEEGTYTIEIAAEGYETLSEMADVQAGEEIFLGFALEEEVIEEETTTAVQETTAAQEETTAAQEETTTQASSDTSSDDSSSAAGESSEYAIDIYEAQSIAAEYFFEAYSVESAYTMVLQMPYSEDERYIIGCFAIVEDTGEITDMIFVWVDANDGSCGEE